VEASAVPASGRGRTAGLSRVDARSGHHSLSFPIPAGAATREDERLRVHRAGMVVTKQLTRDVCRVQGKSLHPLGDGSTLERGYGELIMTP
jgi:hypothetical protein